MQTISQAEKVNDKDAYILPICNNNIYNTGGKFQEFVSLDLLKVKGRDGNSNLPT